MNLSEIFSGQKIFSNQPLTNQNGAETSAAKLQSYLSSLSPGQTVSATVSGIRDNVVSLKLEGDISVEAKLEQALGLAEGANIYFEVRGNSSSSLTLSPLFFNTANEQNASKAINMAGLPINDTTMLLTKSLMSAGLPIDRESLGNIYQETVNNANASVLDIVDLHRLGIPVNETNLEQISSYKNLSYQLGDGMQQVSNDAFNAIKDMIQAGDTENAAKVFQGLLEIAGEVPLDSELLDGKSTNSQISSADIEPNLTNNVTNNSGNDTANISDLANNASNDTAKNSSDVIANGMTEGIANLNAAKNTTSDENLTAAQKALRLLASIQNGENTEAKAGNVNTENASGEASRVNAENAAGEASRANSENAAETLDLESSKATLNTSKADIIAFLNELSDTKLSSEANAQDIFKMAANIIGKAINEGDEKKLGALLNNKGLMDITKLAIKEQWSISPREVASKDNVNELYERLNRQLKMLTEVLENSGEKASEAAKSATNMNNNIDFLNQVNQMFSYIQLPIKLSGGNNAHGDLYVYTNGKKLNKPDGKVSALLHLDMEHLGPIDVYVAMDNSSLTNKLNTQFYVQDDEILDFLSEHMDELTSRLEAKGYSCSMKMHIKGDKSESSEDSPIGLASGGIVPILDGMGHISVGEYSFDVRT